MSKLDLPRIFARATEIANERHPNGCGSTALANILREVIAVLQQDKGTSER